MRDRTPGLLQITLTWVQLVGAVFGIGVPIAGAILYACVEIRSAIRDLDGFRVALEKHADMHDRLERDARIEHREYESRISRLEGLVPRLGGGR